MFAGKDLDELDLAFTIVDDVYKLRKRVFDESGISDRSEDINIVIPEYEKNTTLMRSDLRVSNLVADPYSNSSLESLDGHSLHEDLLSIFEISQMRRAADIKNAYRYNDFYQAYNSRIAIFANEKEFKQSEKEIKDEILILIHMIQEDLEVQIHVKEVFDRIKSKGIEVLNKFFELLVDKDYQTLYEYFK